MIPLDGTARLPPTILGGKGYGIDVMRSAGLPVPPAFCLTEADDSPETGIAWLEHQTSKMLGRGPRSLLVSVRSSPAHSMPGMLDTVLNVGAPADLTQALAAVRASWDSPRATAYRAHQDLDDDGGGRAIVVQAMVFGNADDRSGTGVLFTRNPMSGADEPFGEWLPCRQGEDLVSGTTNGEPIGALARAQPGVYAELLEAARGLERLFADVQDIEFTVEEGRLWLLQTRTAKRSAQAAARLALALRSEGLIDDAEALQRVTPGQVAALIGQSPNRDVLSAGALLASGVPACPGVASGVAYTDVDDAIAASERGQDVVLVRRETSPDDVAGMLVATAIVTEIGGATSHAAIVSRELGRPAVVGCGPGVALALAGRAITVDGDEGEVREGAREDSAAPDAHAETDFPDLRALADIARRIGPLRAHVSGDHPVLPDNSVDSVRKAVAIGHPDVQSPTPLIVMLRAIHDRT